MIGYPFAVGVGVGSVKSIAGIDPLVVGL